MKTKQTNPTRSFLDICGVAKIMSADVKDPIVRKEKAQQIFDSLLVFHFNHKK